MKTAIDDLPTEAMREAARKLVAIFDPLTPAERVALVSSYGQHTNDDQIKALAAAFAHIEQRKQ